MDFQLVKTIPGGLRMEKTAQGFMIDRAWVHGKSEYVFEVVKILLGLSIIYLTMSAVFYINSRTLGTITWLLFLLVTALLGVGLIYHAIVHMVEHGHIEATRQQIRVRNRPLPVWWNRDVSIPLAEIQKFELEERFYSGRKKDKDENTYATFNIFAISPDNQRTRLVSGIYDEAQARFINSELTRFLLYDRAIRGESGSSRE